MKLRTCYQVGDEHQGPDLTRKNELKQRAGPASWEVNQDPVSGQEPKPVRAARTSSAQAVNESGGSTASCRTQASGEELSK
jgi:hypothetical protein